MFELQQKQLSIFTILCIILHDRIFIIKTTLSAMLLGVLYLIAAKSLYTATTQLQINIGTEHVVDIKSVMVGMPLDYAAINSEVDIITSRNLIGKLVDELKLTEDVEFNKQGLWQFFKSEVSAETRRIQVITKVLQNLRVIRRPRSYTIFIRFTSFDAKKAAMIANTLARIYLENQLAIKFAADKRANEWLNNKIRQLKIRVQQSELRLEEFRKKHGLVKTQGITISDQQISELNSQLILARAERTQKEARLDSSRRHTSTLVDVLQSRLIQDLRNQEAKILRKKSDLSSRYGAKHPKMMHVYNELMSLRQKINLEEQKIITSLTHEVNIAKNREEALARSLAQLEKTTISSEQMVELTELERQSKIDQSLYESFLSRFREIEHQQSYASNNVRVVSEASVPIEASSPVVMIVMGVSMLVGLVCGVLVVLYPYWRVSIDKETVHVS